MIIIVQIQKKKKKDLLKNLRHKRKKTNQRKKQEYIESESDHDIDTMTTVKKVTKKPQPKSQHFPKFTWC